MNSDSHSANHISPSERIDLLCDDFEAGWLQGERPKIIDFIGRLAGDNRTVLFYELMLVELEYRLKAGEQPSREDYVRDFPQFADQVAAVYLQFGSDAFRTAAAKKDDAVRRAGYQPGDHIGHFELHALLGSGAMGSVWKAWDPRLQRPVAIKIPRAENLTDDEKHRFLREGRSAAQLRHPNLAAVHEVDRDSDTPYIASEFVDGENLRDYCARSKLAVTTAATESVNRRLTFYAIADLCAEIAEALHHAHEQGVVHRDLKPANIIIDRANRPHVIDFGLAKWSTDDRDLTLHGELLGTPAYMSPEQAAGKCAKLDRRTDVYSLGVILYELLSGQCPFTGEMGSVIHQIIAVEPPSVRKLNTRVPRDLETICIKALEKDPDRRYATMQELAVDLRRFARGEPVLARRAGPLERSWRWVRRHPGVTAAGLAIALIVSTSGLIIRSLNNQNYRLQGYRPVRIDTTPPGARVAFVRLDDATGEPDINEARITRPNDRTPFSLLLRPGNYLVEAALPGESQEVDFVEVYRTVSAAGRSTDAEKRVNRDQHLDEDTLPMSLHIHLRSSATEKMLAVPIGETFRREHPLLPKLLYIDALETKPKADAKSKRSSLSFSEALALAERDYGKRLPSAIEYEAIERAANNNEIFDPNTGKPAQIEDLFDDVAEWTTTKYRLVGQVQFKYATLWQDWRMLAGYRDPDKLTGLTRTSDNKLIASPNFNSPSIGFRGVRSGTPRFVKP